MNFRERLDAARKRYPESLREALSALTDDPNAPKPESAPPPPFHSQCDNHPRKQGFPKLLDLVMATPAGWALFGALSNQLVLEPDYVLPGSEPGPVLKDPNEYGLSEFTAIPMVSTSGTQVISWYHPAKPGFPTMAYCHGNAGSLDARAPVLKEMAAAGFGVMIAAYPGFKGSKTDTNGHAQTPTERGFINTAKGMYSFIQKDLEARKKTDDATNTNIVMFGESLGSAVAMRSAQEIEQGDRYHDKPPRKVAAVVCFAAFKSLPDRVREEYPLMPAAHLMNIQLDAKSVIAKIKAPVLLLHGTSDEVTCHHHSVKLQKIGGENVELILLPDTNHRLTKQRHLPAHPMSPISDSTHNPELLRVDPAQVRNLIAHVQTSLHNKGLCPPPMVPPRETHAPSRNGSVRT